MCVCVCVQSSTLYANNLSKFLTSMGPFTTGNKGVFYLDPENDPVIGGALVSTFSFIDPR